MCLSAALHRVPTLADIDGGRASLPPLPAAHQEGSLLGTHSVWTSTELLSLAAEDSSSQLDLSMKATNSGAKTGSVHSVVNLRPSLLMTRYKIYSSLALTRSLRVTTRQYP